MRPPFSFQSLCVLLSIPLRRTCMQGLVSKRVLVMDFVAGVPLNKLGDRMRERGIQEVRCVHACACISDWSDV